MSDSTVTTQAKQRIYFDWNATAPLRPQAKAAIAGAVELIGNPSSIHAEGRAARRIIEDARTVVANAVGTESARIVFTSGGTEANALALMPGVRRDGEAVRRLIVSAVEHPSVQTGGRFPREDIEIAPVTTDGVVDLAKLEVLLAGKPPALVSVMLANNETGALQPVSEIAALVHAAGGVLHVDAVQALGKIPFNISELDADLLSISAHKVGGAKGVGALVLGAKVAGWEPLVAGGGQEKGHRGGTENLIGIASFGAALTAAMDGLNQSSARMRTLQVRLEERLVEAFPNVVIFSKAVDRLPNTTLFSASGLRAETAVIRFDLEGIAVSSGSACSSGKVRPSGVLTAMGVSPESAQGAIRLSWGWDTTEDDLQAVLDAWRKLSSVLLREQDTVA